MSPMKSLIILSLIFQSYICQTSALTIDPGYVSAINDGSGIHTIIRNNQKRPIIVGLALKAGDKVTLGVGSIDVINSKGVKTILPGEQTHIIKADNTKIDELGAFILAQENVWDQAGFIFPCGLKLHPDNILMAYLTPENPLMRSAQIEIRRINPFKKIVQPISQTTGIIIVKDFFDQFDRSENPKYPDGKYSWHLLWKNDKGLKVESKKCTFEVAKKSELDPLNDQFATLKNLEDPLTLAIMKADIISNNSGK